jgi:hypothetical protein
VADAFGKAVLVASVACMLGMMVMFVRVSAWRMRSDARPPRRMLTISVAFALGTIVTGVIRLFVL